MYAGINIDYIALDKADKDIKSRLEQKDLQILEQSRETSVLKEKTDKMLNWMEHRK